jgi:hypothetical protein
VRVVVSGGAALDPDLAWRSKASAGGSARATASPRPRRCSRSLAPAPRASAAWDVRCPACRSASRRSRRTRTTDGRKPAQVPSGRRAKGAGPLPRRPLPCPRAGPARSRHAARTSSSATAGCRRRPRKPSPRTAGSARRTSGASTRAAGSMWRAAPRR